MTLWQSVDLTCLFDGKSSWTITTLEIFETIDRDSACSSCKLQETTLLFCIPRSNHFPEVLNDFVLLLVATVIGVFLPVVYVDISNTANEKLEFTLVKHVDKISRNQFVETSDEGIELFLDSLHDFPFSHKPMKS